MNTVNLTEYYPMKYNKTKRNQIHNSKINEYIKYVFSSKFKDIWPNNDSLSEVAYSV